MKSDICDRHHRGHGLLELEHAREQLLSAAVPIGRALDAVPLREAGGRILAQTVQLDRDEPPVRRSAMDGFAVRSQDGDAPRTLLGTVYAGTPDSPDLAPGEAVAVMTGGTVADGADSVIPVEYTKVEGDQLHVLELPQAGRHVRCAGEMGKAGREILGPHSKLEMGDLVAIAGCGVDPIQVFPQPQVTILSTGDEVVAWAEKPGPHQVRDSNRLATALQVEKCGGVVVQSRRVPDVVSELQQAMDQALAESDLIITIGGVSMGSKDHMPDVFAAAGVNCLFHGVSVQPGKPVWAGHKGKQWVLGLPGNPVSALVVFELLGKALLEKLAGAQPDSALPFQQGIAGKNCRAKARPRFVLTDLQWKAGRAVLTPRLDTGSGDWTSLAGSRALLHVPSRSEILAGQAVSFLPL